MQRHPALHSLSSEHHTGLVLARRAIQAASDDRQVQSEVWRTLRKRFHEELEPHFQREESGLLPALKNAGELELVARTLREHAALRALIAADNQDRLQHFGDLLKAHIRFEEKQLFETAQQRLDPAILTALADTGQT